MRRNYDTARVPAREAATFDPKRTHLILKGGGTTRATFEDLGDRVRIEILGNHDLTGEVYEVDPARVVGIVLVRR